MTLSLKKHQRLEETKVQHPHRSHDVARGLEGRGVEGCRRMSVCLSRFCWTIRNHLKFKGSVEKFREGLF